MSSRGCRILRRGIYIKKEGYPIIYGGTSHDEETEIAIRMSIIYNDEMYAVLGFGTPLESIKSN